MIDFEHVWLPQIVSYARLISTGQLEDQWLGRSALTSSVINPDELHEQIFDDLDADAIWSEARENAVMAPSAALAIEHFLAALKDVEDSEVAIVVTSDAWVMVKDAAGAVLANVR